MTGTRTTTEEAEERLEFVEDLVYDFYHIKLQYHTYMIDDTNPIPESKIKDYIHSLTMSEDFKHRIYNSSEQEIDIANDICDKLIMMR